MTGAGTLELIRHVDERLRDASDNELLAVSREVAAHLAAATCDPAAVDAADVDVARLARRAEQLAFLVRALDL